MSDTMGTFRIDIDVENPAAPGPRQTVRNVLVDTGAELSWIPGAILALLGIERRKLWRFRQADGSILERWAGQASLYVAGTWTADEIVFGEPGDLVLLGARSLEGLNLRVDPFTKTLVDAGPAPAAPAPGPGEELRLGGPRRNRGMKLARVADRRPGPTPGDPRE